jgi:hypothetical protein
VAFEEAFGGKDSALNPVEDDEAMERLPNRPGARSSKIPVGSESPAPYFRIPTQGFEGRIHSAGETSRQRKRINRIEVCFQQIPAKLPFEIAVESL